MKKFLSSIFIGLLVAVTVGTTFMPQPSYAQTTPPPTQAAVQNANSATASCGWTNPFSIACISDVVFWIPGYIVSYMVMPFMSLLVYMSGILLNWSMEYSVVHMSVHYQETNLDYIWSVLRDVANMGFIFVLLYTAIMSMIGKGDLARTIRNIVIAALLINFSMLITKAVIDASNVLAMLFYNAITPGGTTTTTGIGAAFMNVLNLQSLYDTAGLSGTKLAIVGVMGSIIYLIAAFTFLAVAVMFIIRFVALVFVIILSPVYALAAVLPNASKMASQWKDTLIHQAFFAPIYFALTWVALKVSEGLLAGYSTHYGKLDYAAAVLGQSGTTTNTVKADPTAVGVFMMFAIIISLLLAALSQAKSFASKSPGFINNLTSKAVAGTSGFVFGSVVGGLGRNTIGRIGAKSADDPNLIAAGKQKGMAGAMARLQLYGAKKAASASFDARRATLPTRSIAEGTGILAGGALDSKAAETVGKGIRATGSRLSSFSSTSPIGEKLGLKSIGDKLANAKFDVNKYEAGLNKATSNIPNVGIAGRAVAATGVGTGNGNGYKENTKADKDKDKAFLKERKEADKKNQRKLDMQAGIEASKTDAASRTPEQQKDVKSLVGIIKSMSEKEIEEQKAETLAIKEVAENLSAKNMEKILNSDKFSDDDKGKITTQRFASVQSAADAIHAGTATDADKNRIKNLSDKELEMLPESIFDPEQAADTSNTSDVANRGRAILQALNQGQIDKLTSSNKLTVAEKQAIKDERARPLKDAFATGDSTGNWTDAIDKLSKMGEASLAKLPTGVAANVPSLDNPNVIYMYTPSILNKLAAQSDLNPNKRTAIRDAILNAVHNHPNTAVKAALDNLQVARALGPVTSADRQNILSGLSNAQKKLVQSAEWLESDNGQQIF